MSYRPYASIISEAQAANSNLSAIMINQSGNTIGNLTPVAVDNDGRLTLIDVSDEDSVVALAGVTSASIANNSSGPVALAGRIENITTSFAHGDYLYVSKTGGLTNVLPSIGNAGFLEGDAIIRVGVIVRNSTTPSQKDLLVKMQLVGKL
jgi:hypothetical protein